MLLALLISLVSCSVDDGDKLDFTVASVVEVNMPDTLRLGETYAFNITYEKPSNCHFFANFDYKAKVNTREVAVITGFNASNEIACLGSTVIEDVTLNFVVERDDFYIFKYFQSVDENNTPQFLTIEVPVAVN